MDFPHLADNSFPNVENVNVWKWQNTFDYSRWNAGTRIKLCDVPFCGDYENVVRFDDEAARDAWFDSLSGHSLDLQTDMRLLPDGTIKLPMPFDMAAGFNYLVLDLQPAPGQAPYIAYENPETYKRRFFFFVDDMRNLAPNTTELMLSLDWWQTYIYDMEFGYAQLDRGHAPMAAMPASEYLANPAANCSGLLAPDVTADEARTMRESVQAIINAGPMFACFATTADLGGSWGTKAANTWEVAEFNSAAIAGQPANIRLYAVAAGQYGAFCDWIEANRPQFVQTVQGVFLLPEMLLQLSGVFTLGSVPVYVAAPQNSGLANFRLAPEMFGYPEDYSEIAKLYTAPYAHLELTDWATGQSVEIRIEDTRGELALEALPNLIWPYVSVDIILAGAGGSAGSVSFQRIGAEGLFEYGGMWYRHMVRANVPVYAMTQGNSRYFDFSTHFTRRQQAAELDTLLTNNNASADMMLTNTNIAITASVDNLNTAQDAETYIRGRNTDKLTADMNADINYATTYNAITAAAELTQSNINKSQTVANALSGAVIGIATVGIGVATGGTGLIAEAAMLGGAATTVSSITSASISVCSVDANVNLTLSTNASVLAANVAQIRAKTGYANTLARETQNSQQQATRTQLYTSNSANRQQMSNNRDLTRANAARANNVGHTGITRQVSQAELMAPTRFGSTTDTTGAGIRPLGAALNIVTQSDSAIRYAGDTFLRYGYNYAAPWQIGELNLMPKFTYWKCSEVWMSGARPALEGAQRRIKEIFAAGFTCWRDPADIGRASIYDNEMR